MMNRRLPLFLLLGACAPVVYAHPAALHRADVLSAFLHPFSGVDHLLAMVIIGAWAARAQVADRMLAPLTFCVALAAGALLATAGQVAPGIEAFVALGLVALGPLAARAGTLPRTVTIAACALAGLAHGQAHGSELTGLADALTPWVFVLGTVVLHACGYALARAMRTAHATQMLGRALEFSGLAGLWLLIAA